MPYRTLQLVDLWVQRITAIIIVLMAISMRGILLALMLFAFLGVWTTLSAFVTGYLLEDNKRILLGFMGIAYVGLLWLAAMYHYSLGQASDIFFVFVVSAGMMVYYHIQVHRRAVSIPLLTRNEQDFPDVLDVE